jgi:hypothetical protein
MFVEREIQQVNPARWEQLEVLDKKYDAIESKAGFPPKRRLRSYIGRLDNSTLVIERDWESLSAMEAAYRKVMVDPEWQVLMPALNEIVTRTHVEIYLIL